MVILHPRGFVLARFGRNSSFKAEICKKYSCIDPGVNFLEKNRMTLAFILLHIFACKLSSLGPGAELLPQATEIDQWAIPEKSADPCGLRVRARKLKGGV